MKPGEQNGTHRFTVTYPPPILRKIKRLAAGLESDEELQRFTTAVRLIDVRLHTEPRLFGEPKFSFPFLRLTLRTAAVRPLSITYVVHDRLPWVLVREVALLQGNEP